MRRTLFILGLLLICSPSYAQTSVIDGANLYLERYKLTDPFSKLINNTGDGYEELYGTRNFRVVLSGVQYRGGGNNTYHRTTPRSNVNPLPTDGLVHLCQQGFSLAIYAYADNFNTAPKEIRCESAMGPNVLSYVQISPLASTENMDKILELIFSSIQNYTGPIYTHCWNGWHASGYMSAISLRQFCGVSADDAVAYWDRNTDGFNTEPQFETIRKKIRSFVPRERFQIREELKTAICLSLKP